MAALSVQKAAGSSSPCAALGKAQLQQQVLLRCHRGEREPQNQNTQYYTEASLALWSPFFTFHWGIQAQARKAEVCFCPSSIEKLTI